MIRLIASVTFPEGIADGEPVSLTGAVVSVETETVPPELAPVILIMMAETLLKDQIKRNLEHKNPLASAEVTDTMAMLNARLRLVDEVMHLPMVDPADILSSPF